MISHLGIFYLCVNVGLVNAQAAQDHSIKLLYKHLFVDNDYNNKVRPQIDWTKTTVVNTSLVIVNLIGYDEVTEKLSLTGKMRVEWIDEYLTWDPAQFGGITLITVPETDIWTPDIALENSVTSYTDLGSGTMYVAIDNTGHVVWKPMKAFHSSCLADVKQFPLDEQSCLLKFEVWSHPVDAVRMNTNYDEIKLHGYNGLPEWEISNTKAEILFQEGDLYAGFSITLKRKPLYLFINVILPIVVISFLGQCVFLLPLESGEKASFAVTVLLSLTVFLTIVSHYLPNTSDNVSIFNVFVFTQVLFCTLTTAITLLQLRLFYTDDEVTVPLCIQKLVTLRLLPCKGKRNLVQSDSFIPDETKPNKAGDKKNSVLSLTDMKNDMDVENGRENKDSIPQSRITWKKVAIWIDLRAYMTFVILNLIFILYVIVV